MALARKPFMVVEKRNAPVTHFKLCRFCSLGQNIICHLA